MSPKALLEFEVSLLLLRYEKDAILSALAAQTNTSVDELKIRLHELAVSASARKKKARKGSSFSLDSLRLSDPSKALMLERLLSRFENRTFLPELKDVKRFLERQGRPASPKSRSTSMPQVFKVLANLDTAALERFASESTTGSGTSSLGIISDEILGRRGIK